MSTALWTIGFIVFVLLVRLMMRRVALSRLYSSNLFKFLQSDEWKSIQDCYDAGFRKKSTARILEFFYQQKRLEVRLPDHRFNCEACGVHIADRVIRDPNFNYDDLPKNLTLEELKKSFLKPLKTICSIPTIWGTLSFEQLTEEVSLADNSKNVLN